MRRTPKACRRCGVVAIHRGQRCDPCTTEHVFFKDIASGRMEAQGEICRARRRGDLASPRNFTCVDCGVPATDYDHRDYGHPLRVEPTCRGCNVRRKSARPRHWSELDALRALVTSASRNRAYGPKSSLWHQMFRRIPERLHGTLRQLIAAAVAQGA